MVLESPRFAARVILHEGRAAALFHALARPAKSTDLPDRIPGLSMEVAHPLLSLLHAGGMLAEVDDTGTIAEDAAPALASWEFHDLLFHARSRRGRHDFPLGAAFPQVGRGDPPPAVRPATAAEMIELHRPDIARLRRQDPPFADVQERRQSLREYALEAITDRQLGEFLYRVARVKALEQHEVESPRGPVWMEFAVRPYPAGGALYELEVYPAIRRCAGLGAGLYHYDGLHHRLERMCGVTAEVERLWEDAAIAAGISADRLQVLLILAARWPRIAWKYSGIAYALVLKHVGVVYQTMYLVATAMDLAPCAVGCGDSDGFARAAGIDYYAETSVGEFLLGSKH
jgi:SagB-type dehydrogenase family enzyme